jgi:phytoene dehydrogenase-like protein
MDADVVIIGAGAAGLLAASTLVDAGIQPLVLEARTGGLDQASFFHA